MTRTRVVVIATDDDLAADMVVRHFGRTTFVRLDPGKLRHGIPVHARIGGGADGLTVGTPLSPSTSVFWRKPTRATSLSGEAAQAADEATMAVLGTLRAAGITRWLNEPCAVDLARPKVVQLRLAQELGLLVPDTLITTHVIEAQDFASAGRTVTKQLTGRYGEFTPARELATGERLRLSGPTAFQRMVDKAADLRVTVVGEEVFACRITSPDLDWRVDHAACRFEPTKLDHTTAQALVRFLQRSGLAYGAFDLAETADGVPWFLECNAAGEYGFQEALTGAPITQAMAGWLLD
ncbi:hypothetical protein ACFY00_30000 [Kitasatospora sp. NPDC001540]|uniref:hypothetical protein n=1 Tax=Kitasatospora sp. NPDC001540 TaxID=3364014 RepID=UPI0036B48A8D